ncbi:Permease of the drug/metabolite transporter (DMT) superfamily [Polaromonas sp. CG9_12]|nr:Permease of the drug/metabolite transporter (DMT) superfamily [Polaromonas sp. CG9_12]
MSLRSTVSSASRKLRLAAALFTVYVLWATSYLAIKHAVGVFPPLLMSGLRSLLAAAVLYGLLRLGGQTLPPFRQWRDASWVGIFATTGGSALLAMGMRDTPSGMAAVLYATMPIFACLMLVFWWGARISGLQWLGSAFGLVGIILLNRDAFWGSAASLDGPPRLLGPGLVLASAACTALAAALTSRGKMPHSVLASTCIQLLVGGVVTTLVAIGLGQDIGRPSGSALGAFLYLSLVISVCGCLAFNDLTHRAGPAVATSYAYVNPPVALALGALFLGESVTGQGMLAMVIVLLGVAMMLYSTTRLSADSAPNLINHELKQ